MSVTAEKSRVEVLNKRGKIIAVAALSDGRLVNYMFSQKATVDDREAWFSYVSALRVGKPVETSLKLRPL